jgi:hypothetical protein
MYSDAHARCNADAYHAIDNKQMSSPTQPAAVAVDNADCSPIAACGEQQLRVTNQKRLVSSFAPRSLLFGFSHALNFHTSFSSVVPTHLHQINHANLQVSLQQCLDCRTHLSTGNMACPIPTSLLQQLWRILIRLPWLQPEQERPLLEYRKAMLKADENPLNPSDQIELFNRADIMQHMASLLQNHECDFRLT